MSDIKTSTLNYTGQRKQKNVFIMSNRSDFDRQNPTGMAVRECVSTITVDKKGVGSWYCEWSQSWGILDYFLLGISSSPRFYTSTASTSTRPLTPFLLNSLATIRNGQEPSLSSLGPLSFADGFRTGTLARVMQGFDCNVCCIISTQYHVYLDRKSHCL